MNYLKPIFSIFDYSKSDHETIFFSNEFTHFFESLNIKYDKF